MKLILQITVLFLAFIIFSCSKKKPDPTLQIDYKEAYKTLKDGGYLEAAKAFEKIESDYPFSKWAAKAQTMAAYAYYKNKDYEDLERVIDDFVRINPSHENIDYMIYLRGISYFERIPDIKRSQDFSKQASMNFRELIARFPESEYAKDAKIKLISVDEHIAGAIMSVARYQQIQENYIGAIKNFQEVIDRYFRTNQLEEAYYRIFEIYKKIGVEEEATKAYFNLSHKFPNGAWLKRAQKLNNL